tara:strand:- start:506 stop:817 length:312 start_codon:yes stop_codon:yes gene_type:complete
MDLAFTEEHEHIKGLKAKEFTLQAISNDATEDNCCFWVVPLRTKNGDHVGWFCNFSDDECEYHLNNDKGSVRIFKTIESAVNFYKGITLSNGDCIFKALVSLV